MTQDTTGTQRRKQDHIRINLEEDVLSRMTSGFERFRFIHNALPEMSLADIELTSAFLGRSLKTPILVSSMTGGVERGLEITRNLAKAAQAVGCAMGVGSQRVAIEDPELSSLFNVRDVAPDVMLFANLGAVQLNYGFGVDECQRAVDMIGADALIFHLNPLQEALQPEGNTDFSALLGKIGKVAASLDVPVIVKEVGFGMSGDVARRLVEHGVAAIDVSGAGGTSWSAVEHYRATTPMFRRLSKTFTDWGIPTAKSLQMVHSCVPGMPLIASGGMRTGIDAAKAIVLGADLAGFAGPVLKAASDGEDTAYEMLRCLSEELRLAMFASGVRTIDELRGVTLATSDGEPLRSTPDEHQIHHGFNMTTQEPLHDKDDDIVSS